MLRQLKSDSKVSSVQLRGSKVLEGLCRIHTATSITLWSATSYLPALWGGVCRQSRREPTGTRRFINILWHCCHCGPRRWAGDVRTCKCDLSTCCRATVRDLVWGGNRTWTKLRRVRALVDLELVKRAEIPPLVLISHYHSQSCSLLFHPRKATHTVKTVKEH